MLKKVACWESSHIKGDASLDQLEEGVRQAQASRDERQ